jgi:hypothetical protein
MHGLASEHGVSLVPSKAWLHRVLDVYLTWTPKIQDLLEKQIKLAKIVFYFNEGVEEPGGDDLKEVAVLLRSYLASLNTDDIKEIGADVLRHRVILSYEAEADGKSADYIIKIVFDSVEVP